MPSRPASAFGASCGGSEGEAGRASSARLCPSLLRRAFAVGRPRHTSRSRTFGLWCRNAAPVKSRQNVGLSTAVRSVCAARGGSAALPAPRSSLSPSPSFPLLLPPSLQPGLCRTAAATARTAVGGWMVFFPALSVTPFRVNLALWKFTLSGRKRRDGAVLAQSPPACSGALC